MKLHHLCKKRSAFVLLHHLTTFITTTLFFTLVITAFADSETEIQAIEKDIATILRDKSGISRENPIEFKFSSNFSPHQKVALMQNLRSTLYKVTHFAQLPRLTSILITDESKRNSFDYLDGAMTLTLSTKDKVHPWVSLLSSDPIHEDAALFTTDQANLRVDQLRYTPPIATDGNPAITKTSSLPFRPYSSSYLSLKHGEILDRPDENNFNGTFKNDISKNYESRSPIERFDYIRQNKLGYPTSLLTKHYLKKIHNPKAQYWEGHCNQWSASSLDPEVNQFISSTQGVICDNIFISEGELKELFTLFYSDYIPKFVAGNRTWIDPSENNLWLRSELGIDDLRADTFHTNLHRYLQRSKGLVIEISANSEVWNQPIYKAQSTILRSSDNPKQIEMIAPLIPARLIESSDVKDIGIIEEYQRIENELIELQKGEIEIESEIKPWAASVKKITKNIFKRSLSDLMKRRSEIFVNQILPSITKGKLTLKKGITADFVRTNVTYGSETFFATEGYNYSQRSYDYLLFKKGDDIIDGRWITEPSNRPDFLWVPKNKRDALIGRKELAPEVHDLFRLSKYCKKASDIFSFFAFVRKALSDGMITTTEKKEISTRYTDVAQFVNTQELQNLFKQKKLRGVDISDLFLDSR